MHQFGACHPIPPNRGLLRPPPSTAPMHHVSDSSPPPSSPVPRMHPSTHNSVVSPSTHHHPTTCPHRTASHPTALVCRLTKRPRAGACSHIPSSPSHSPSRDQRHKRCILSFRPSCRSLSLTDYYSVVPTWTKSRSSCAFHSSSATTHKERRVGSSRKVHA